MCRRRSRPRKKSFQRSLQSSGSCFVASCCRRLCGMHRLADGNTISAHASQRPYHRGYCGRKSNFARLALHELSVPISQPPDYSVRISLSRPMRHPPPPRTASQRNFSNARCSRALIVTCLHCPSAIRRRLFATNQQLKPNPSAASAHPEHVPTASFLPAILSRSGSSFGASSCLKRFLFSALGSTMGSLTLQPSFSCTWLLAPFEQSARHSPFAPFHFTLCATI